MVECRPWMTLMVGSAVSQWAETTRMAVGLRGNTFCCQDRRKCLAGSESSIERVGDPWDMKKVSIATWPWILSPPVSEIGGEGDGGDSKIARYRKSSSSRTRICFTLLSLIHVCFHQTQLTDSDFSPSLPYPSLTLSTSIFFNIISSCWSVHSTRHDRWRILPPKLQTVHELHYIFFLKYI